MAAMVMLLRWKLPLLLALVVFLCAGLADGLRLGQARRSAPVALPLERVANKLVRGHGQAAGDDAARRFSFLDVASRGSLLSSSRSSGTPEAAKEKKNTAAELKLSTTQHLFVTKVHLGDGQHLQLLVDTGSGNLAVPSRACSTAGCEGHRRYRPEEDSDSNLVPGVSDVALSFGTGRLAGSGFEGGVCLTKERCAVLRFIVASMESEEFKSFNFDGILGLGLPPQAVGEGFNVLSSLAKQKLIPTAAFTVSLRRHDGDSALALGTASSCSSSNVSSVATSSGGDANSTSADCGAGWTKLAVDARHGEWAVSLQDVLVDGRSFELCGRLGCRAVLDTGCGGIGVPKGMHQQLKEHLQMRDCSYAAATLPKLSFDFGAHRFEVGPERYVEYDEADPSRCKLLINELEDTSTRTLILGIPFLLDRDVRFDQAALVIEVADAAAPPAKTAEKLGSPEASGNASE